MNSLKIGIPNYCKFCRHYQPEGRREGHCSKLQVSVGGSWQSCSLMSLAFDSQNIISHPSSLEREFMLVATEKAEQKRFV